MNKIITISREFGSGGRETGIYSYAFQFAKSFSMPSSMQNNQTNILVAQQKVLKEIASKGNCIIVGRSANTVLKEYEPMNIFVYADMESKINRCKIKRKDEELTDKEIKNKII